MGKYVDGFVIPIAKDKVEQYREMAQKAGEVWKEHGALEFYETVGDDLEIKDMLSFKTIAGTSEDESVIFSWIVNKSKDQRDKINAAVMEALRIKEDIESNKDVFDLKRLAYGGLKTLVTI